MLSPKTNQKRKSCPILSFNTSFFPLLSFPSFFFPLFLFSFFPLFPFSFFFLFYFSSFPSFSFGLTVKKQLISSIRLDKSNFSAIFADQ